MKPKPTKPVVREPTNVERDTSTDPWAELDDNPELLERYQFIAGDLLDRDDYTMDTLKDEINKIGSMEKWCRRHENNEWVPLVWDTTPAK